MGYKNNIITSLITRFIGAFVTFGISIINARELGTEKMGEIGLVVSAITISMLVSGILSGPSLVYFTPRKKLKHLLVPGYVANIICSVLICVILSIFDLFNHKYLIYAILISLFQGLYSTNFYVLLGLEKLNAYNFIGIIQVLISIIGIAISVYIFKIKNVESYFVAQTISFIVGFLITLPFIKQKSYSDERSGYSNVIKDIFAYGFVMQIASIFQSLNYRLSYYIINWQLGTAKLGIFVLTMQLVEGVLMISRSIAVVLFSRTSNLTEKENIREKTNSTLKFTYVSTFIFLVVMLGIPVSFYEMVFSKDFSETKMILWFFAPGIMFLAIQTILSSYFSSIHKVYVNAIGSFIGMVVIGGTVWHLTMMYDLEGAAISNVASYLISMLVSLTFYLIIEKNRLSSILINGSDIKKYMKVFSFKKTT